MNKTLLATAALAIALLGSSSASFADEPTASQNSSVFENFKGAEQMASLSTAEKDLNGAGIVWIKFSWMSKPAPVCIPSKYVGTSGYMNGFYCQ